MTQLIGGVCRCSRGHRARAGRTELVFGQLYIVCIVVRYIRDIGIPRCFTTIPEMCWRIGTYGLGLRASYSYILQRMRCSLNLILKIMMDWLRRLCLQDFCTISNTVDYNDEGRYYLNRHSFITSLTHGLYIDGQLSTCFIGHDQYARDIDRRVTDLGQSNRSVTGSVLMSIQDHGPRLKAGTRPTV